jgi:ABC-type phosphate transport system substrate-binding protein
MIPNNHRHVAHCLAFVTLLLLPPGLLADGLVVTGAKSPLTALSKDQLSDLFLGKIASLPDGSGAILIDQPESSPLRNEFYLKVTNRSAAQARAHWAKLYFTGRGVPPRVATDSANIKEMLNSIPGAIGYIEDSALDSSVKVIYVVH